MIYVTEDSTYFRWQAHIWESTLHYTASSGSAEGRMAFKYTEVAVITPICSHRLWSIGGIPKIVCPGTCRLNLPQLSFTPISAGWPICTGGPQTRQKVKQTKKCTFKRTSREASNFDARWGKEMQKAPEVSKVRVIIRNIRKCLCKCPQIHPKMSSFKSCKALGILVPVELRPILEAVKLKKCVDSNAECRGTMGSWKFPCYRTNLLGIFFAVWPHRHDHVAYTGPIEDMRGNFRFSNILNPFFPGCFSRILCYCTYLCARLRLVHNLVVGQQWST